MQRARLAVLTSIAASFLIGIAGGAHGAAGTSLTKESVIGHQVVDEKGESVGDVVSVYVDKGGTITQLVVKTGGKSVLLPATSVVQQGDVIRASMSAEQIVKLPAAANPDDDNSSQ